MEIKQIIQSWAIVLALPVVSLGISGIVVSLQQGSQMPVAMDIFENAVAAHEFQTQPATSQSDSHRLVAWRTVRTEAARRSAGAQETVQEPSGDPQQTPETPFGDPLNPPQDNPQDMNPQDLQNLLQETPQGQQDDLSRLLQDPDQLPSSQDMPLPELPLRATPPMDDQFVGWQQADVSPGDSGVGSLLRANWISLRPNGTLYGQLGGQSLEPLPYIELDTKVFLINKGRLVADTVVNDDGSFKLDGLTPGSYTVFVYGPRQMSAFGLIALPYNGLENNHPTDLNILTSDRGGMLLNEILKQEAIKVRFPLYKLYEIGEAATDPPQLFGFSGLSTHNPVSIPANTIEMQPIELHQGTLVGRLHRFDNASGRPIYVKDANVSLIQDSQVVANTEVNRFGVFRISDLRPGFYSLVAAGADGFGTIGVELVDRSTSSRNPGPQFVSASNDPQIDQPPTFDMALIQSESIGWINDFVIKQSYQEAIRRPLPPEPESPFDYPGWGYPGSGYPFGGQGCGPDCGGLGHGGGCGCGAPDCCGCDACHDCLPADPCDHCHGFGCDHCGHR